LDEALIDSDILSLFFRGHAEVGENVRRYLDLRPSLNLSILTYYEILRGLEHVGSRRRVAAFEEWIALNRVIPMDIEVAKIAARIYAGLKKKGRPIGEADVLIAATALRYDWVLVTNNLKHFERVPHLRTVSWVSAKA